MNTKAPSHSTLSSRPESTQVDVPCFFRSAAGCATMLRRVVRELVNHGALAQTAILVSQTCTNLSGNSMKNVSMLC